jgi:protein TonB
VAGAAAPLIGVMPRDRASRSLGAALLASVLLHALALATLPSLRELAARLPPSPAPLIARLAQREAPPAASAPEHEVSKPAPPKPAAPKPQAAVAGPLPAAASPMLLPQEPSPKPAARPLAAPALQPAPATPVQSAPPASAPSPASAAAPAASGVLSRLESLPVPAAPPGPDPGALERYRLQLVTVAARFKRYPRAAIDNNWEGAVVVRMTVGADGRIAALGIAQSSGHEVLDQQALEMFRTANRYVPVPAELAGRAFELELRAIYSLRDQPAG